jgi:hypothetical protein
MTGPLRSGASMAATGGSQPAVRYATELLNVNRHGAAKPVDSGIYSRSASAVYWETCVAITMHRTRTVTRRAILCTKRPTPNRLSCECDQRKLYRLSPVGITTALERFFACMHSLHAEADLGVSVLEQSGRARPAFTRRKLACEVVSCSSCKGG